jgi:hypothetical protein
MKMAVLWVVASCNLGTVKVGATRTSDRLITWNRRQVAAAQKTAIFNFTLLYFTSTVCKQQLQCAKTILKKCVCKRQRAAGEIQQCERGMTQVNKILVEAARVFTCNTLILHFAFVLPTRVAALWQTLSSLNERRHFSPWFSSLHLLFYYIYV